MILYVRFATLYAINDNVYYNVRASKVHVVSLRTFYARATYHVPGTPVKKPIRNTPMGIF